MEQHENLVLEYFNKSINEEQEVPVLEIDENNVGVKFHILTSKDVTLLRGVTGCGKTQVCAFLIRQLILKKPDTFFRRLDNGKPFLVYVFETEMSVLNILGSYLKNAFPEFNKNKLCDELTISERCPDINGMKRLFLKSFRKYSLDDRKKKLEEFANELNKFSKSHNIVILIDNIGSFSSDLNSGQNNQLINEIFSALSDFTVLIVMHTNHKESSSSKNNATGLVGSVVERIAQNIFEIFKNESKKVSMKLVKSKTQDDKLNLIVDFLQDESDEKYFVKDVVTSNNLSIEKQKNKSGSRVSHEDFEIRIKKFIKPELNNSNKRTRKCIEEIFPEYKQKAILGKIKDLVDAKVLIDTGGFLFHKDELPF